MNRNHHLFIIATFFLTLLVSCSESPQEKADEAADLIIFNAEVATVNAEMPKAEALAVRAGRIIKVGNNEEIRALTGENTEMIDADGQFVMPGFIEGHGHFSGLGKSLINVNLLGTKSWEEVVRMVEERVKDARPGEWIEGRGWHQEKWVDQVEPNYFGYPDHEMLSAVSPDNPVVLRHASGHSLFANAKAMEAAGVSRETPDPKGGAIIRDSRGEAIGVFEERAMKVIMDPLYDYLETISAEARLDKWKRGIDLAEQECLAKGITSFQDAGSLFWELEEYEKMAEKGELDLRLWAMVRHPYDTMVGRLAGYPKIDLGGGFFTCRAIKSEVDGALGAFGAWLLRAYNDKPGFSGQNTTEVSEVERIGELAYENGMQLCVHAIGDRANREVLNIFEKFVKREGRTDLRWRVEHAQHLDTTDIPRFAKLGAIASMQAIHCTSDAPFVEKRLGQTRSKKGAYAWRALLDAGAVVTNGTDAPVEDVDPIESFYASVTRKRADSGMAFFTEQRMTREEALYSYTRANAYAAFEEKEKGSLEAGKLADIVILSQNLLTCPDEDILNAKVLYTIVDGNVKYKAVD